MGFELYSKHCGLRSNRTQSFHLKKEKKNFNAVPFKKLFVDYDIVFRFYQFHTKIFEVEGFWMTQFGCESE